MHVWMLFLLFTGLWASGEKEPHTTGNSPRSHTTRGTVPKHPNHPGTFIEEGRGICFLSPFELSFPKEGGTATVTAQYPWSEFTSLSWNESGCPYPSKEWFKNQDTKRYSLLPAPLIEGTNGKLKRPKPHDGLCTSSYLLIFRCEKLERKTLLGNRISNGKISDPVEIPGYWYYGTLNDCAYFIGDSKWMSRIQGTWFSLERNMEDWFVPYEKPDDLITESSPENVLFYVENPNSRHELFITLAPNSSPTPRTLIINVMYGLSTNTLIIRQA